MKPEACSQPGSGFRYAPGHDGRGFQRSRVSTISRKADRQSEMPWRSPLPSRHVREATDGPSAPNVVTRAEWRSSSAMLYGAGVAINQFAEDQCVHRRPLGRGLCGLCSSLGIVAGVGEGKFDPNATVTTAQAVLMLCRALAYFQNAADFGDNWMLAATAKGTALGLYGDLKLAANEGLTRDNVAELVFNALTKAVPVQYNELLGVYYNENKGILYSLTYYYTDTLGYKNFDLVYKTNENTDYSRPHLGASAPIGWTATPPARATRKAF